METTKLLAGETNILSHGSTHRLAMDMGVLPNDRGHQTAYTVKRLNFFMVILACHHAGWIFAQISKIHGL